MSIRVRTEATDLASSFRSQLEELQHPVHSVTYQLTRGNHAESSPSTSDPLRNTLPCVSTGFHYCMPPAKRLSGHHMEISKALERKQRPVPDLSPSICERVFPIYNNLLATWVKLLREISVWYRATSEGSAQSCPSS